MQKVLIITPHLSTGGLPQYLLWQIRQMMAFYDIFVVEYKQLSHRYTVQREKIIKQLPENRFYSLEEPSDLLSIIRDFAPNIIHFYEFSETFCNRLILEKIYQKDRSYSIFESTHSSIKINKIFIPDKFIFVSSYSCQMYSPLKVPYQLIEYSIENKDNSNKSNILTSLSLNPNKKHILNVGLFNENKNQKEIFELAALLPEYDFHFIGNLADNYKEYWEPLVSNKPSNCYIYGEIEDVDSWYSACDLFLFTSNFELNPLCIKEAISYGMKVVLRNLESYNNKYQEGNNIRFLSKDIHRNVKIIRDVFNNKYSNEFDLAFKTSEKKLSNEVNIIYHFASSPTVEITGGDSSAYQVKFINKETNNTEFEQDIYIGETVRYPKNYFINWRIVVLKDGVKVFDYDLDLKDQRVFVCFHSQGLGDTLAWIPYVEEFRKKHNCKIICLTKFNELFIDSYPNITFVEPEDSIPNIFARYDLGCWDLLDRNKTPRPWNSIPLQDVAKDILGLQNLGEIKPLLSFYEDDHKNENNLICIATESTSGCKYWNYKDGWKDVCQFLISKGYNVVNLSKNGIKIDGVKNIDEEESFQSIMSYLKNCKLFIGLPSGISWLAWGMGAKVVMISGFSEPWIEFSNKININPPLNKCRGCYSRYKFDPKNWYWCPENKEFECTKSIEPTRVKDVLLKVLG